MKEAQALDDYLSRFEERLPTWLARFFKFIRQPSLIWLRVPLAILLMAGGVLSFLPILGIWMLPLGLLLLAEDVPFLQRPLVTALEWIEAHWPWGKKRGQ
jgi:hypothetical protein